MQDMRPVTDDKRVLRVFVDGHEITPALLVVSSKYGTFELGLRPEGFHGWLWREPDGKGVATLLWTRDPSGTVLVGLVEEHRPNMGPEPALCLMGGLPEPGETVAESQARESMEEGGVDTRTATALPGLPVIQDRLYWKADPHAGEGVHLFELEIDFSALERLDEDQFTLASKDVNAESRILFLPIKKCMLMTADALALSAMGRLIVELNLF